MKRLIILFVIVVSSFSVNGQTFDYSASVETGYYQGSHTMTIIADDIDYPLNMKYPDFTFYSDIQFSLHFFDKKLNFQNSPVFLMYLSQQFPEDLSDFI